jgi:hypothetical protein
MTGRHKNLFGYSRPVLTAYPRKRLLMGHLEWCTFPETGAQSSLEISSAHMRRIDGAIYYLWSYLSACLDSSGLFTHSRQITIPWPFPKCSNMERRVHGDTLFESFSARCTLYEYFIGNQRRMIAVRPYLRTMTNRESQLARDETDNQRIFLKGRNRCDRRHSDDCARYHVRWYA